MTTSMTSFYKFRSIDPADYDKGLIELLSELTTIDKNKISKRAFESYVREQHVSPSRDTLVLEKEGKIIATGTIYLEQKLIHNLGVVAHIEDIVVKKEFRGQDIGKALIDTLVNVAEECECYKVILDCNEKNVGFYEKCGFRKNGVEMRIDITE